METQEIAFPIVHHRISSEVSTSEHELMVDGVIFGERKEMIKTSIDSDDVKTLLVHTKFIGDEDYLKVTQSLKNGELEDEKIDHNLENDEEAVENFKNEWENGWHPFFTSTEADVEAQGSTGMANKIKKFFGLN